MSRLSALEQQTITELWNRGDDLSRRAAVLIKRLEEARHAYEKERDWLDEQIEEARAA